MEENWQEAELEIAQVKEEAAGLRRENLEVGELNPTPIKRDTSKKQGKRVPFCRTTFSTAVSRWSSRSFQQQLSQPGTSLPRT